MLSLPTDVRALLHPPPVHFKPLAERAARGPVAVGGVQGVAATLCRYVYSSHNRLSFVTVLIVLLQGEGFMRWYLSPYRHPPYRREAYETRVPPACGRTQGRLCAYSYSNSIIVCWPWFVSNSPTHPSYLVESVVEYPPCGSEAHRAAQMVSVYSYSINIFGLSTSCPLPPPDMHRAMPWGDTITPFCEGE